VSVWDSRLGSTVTRRGSRGGPTSRQPARLCAIHPLELACEVSLALDRDRVVLGRNPEPEDVPRLRHPTVSRQHAAIEWDARARAFLIADLGSHNGTTINGARAAGGSRTRLDSGDVVRLGDVLCVFECGEELDEEDARQVSRDAIPGDSAAARAIRAQIGRAAADPSPALVVGPTGTGKESVAAELHRLSGRAGALVTVNCAAVSAQLFESQLFGHEKGAFTGATSAQPGMFRAAQRGTLFLDEIGEMPLDLQAKLLRAVQQGEIVAVGSSRAERVDVRVIAATNRDLEAEVERGGFRRDLYARLAMWQVRVPALSERRADLLSWLGLLHRAWLERRPGKQGELDLAVDAAEELLLADWPDNLRGLERLVHELAARPGQVVAASLPAWIRRRTSDEPPEVAAPAPPPAPTRDELLAILEANAWSVRAAAKQLQRDRRQIYRWMESMGIEKPPGDG